MTTTHLDEDWMIVKVQISLSEPRRALIYNEDRSLMYQEDVSEDVLKLMAGRSKAFFYARRLWRTKMLELGHADKERGEPPWQEW